MAAFKERLKKWGHPVTLKELGVDRDQLPAIAQNAFDFKLPALVKEMTIADMEAILDAVYE